MRRIDGRQGFPSGSSRRWLPGTLADVRRGRPQKDQREAVKSVISTYQWFRTKFAAHADGANRMQTPGPFGEVSASRGGEGTKGGSRWSRKGEKANAFSLRDQWFESMR